MKKHIFQITRKQTKKVVNILISDIIEINIIQQMLVVMINGE